MWLYVSLKAIQFKSPKWRDVAGGTVFNLDSLLTNALRICGRKLQVVGKPQQCNDQTGIKQVTWQGPVSSVLSQNHHGRLHYEEVRPHKAPGGGTVGVDPSLHF